LTGRALAPLPIRSRRKPRQPSKLTLPPFLPSPPPDHHAAGYDVTTGIAEVEGVSDQCPMHFGNRYSVLFCRTFDGALNIFPVKASSADNPAVLDDKPSADD
jgi:hypothetical protein